MKVVVDENELIKQMMRVNFQVAQHAVLGTILRYGSLCHSPIELMMLHGIMQMAPSYGDFFDFVRVPDCGSHAWSDAVGFSDEDGVPLLVLPQAEIEPYVVDFCLLFKPSPKRVAGIVVECDGHEYHNDSKKQVSHDRKKDRHLQQAGYTVLRFTGSDIHGRLLECVKEVYRAAVDCMVREAAGNPGPVVLQWSGRYILTADGSRIDTSPEPDYNLDNLPPCPEIPF